MSTVNKMNESEYIFERMNQLLYPLQVEIDVLTGTNTIECIKVTASTGQRHVAMRVTIAMLEHTNIAEIATFVKKKLNHDLEKAMIAGYLDGVNRGIIVSTSMPIDKIYTIVHPEKYVELLKELGNGLFDCTQSNTHINWKKILGG